MNLRTTCSYDQITIASLRPGWLYGNCGCRCTRRTDHQLAIIGTIANQDSA